MTSSSSFATDITPKLVFRAKSPPFFGTLLSSLGISCKSGVIFAITDCVALSAFAFAATVECRNGFLSHLKEEILEEMRQGDASQGKYFYDLF